MTNIPYSSKTISKHKSFNNSKFMRLVLKYIFKIIFLISLPLYGQVPFKFYENLSFKNYTSQNGISQRSITSITEDTFGFIWVGTRFGLNKFDGVNFYNYYSNVADENTLSSNYITCILPYLNGQLFVGTLNGLNLYQSYSDNFLRIDFNLFHKDDIDLSITDLQYIDSERIAVGSNHGLIIYNLRDKESKLIFHDYNNREKLNSSLSSNNIISSYKINNELWICTNNSINILNLKTFKVRLLKYPTDSTKDKSKGVIYSDHNSQIYLGYDKGLAQLDPTDSVFKKISINKNKDFLSDHVRTIIEDENFNLWIGTYTGLFKINPSRKDISKYVNDFEDPRSLSANSIYDIHIDSRGDIWIGTWGGGVNYLDVSSTNFRSFSAGTSHKNLNSNVVSSIIEDSLGNLWIGTESGGLNYFDRKTEQFHKIGNNNNGLSENNVKALLKDDLNNLWIGTNQSGLNYLQLNNNGLKFTQYRFETENENSLRSDRITCLEKDKYDNIWIGTSGGGLNYKDVETGVIQKLKDPDMLLGDVIHTIVESYDKNNLYISGAKGIVRMNLQNFNLAPLFDVSKIPNPLGSNMVTSILPISNELIWIGTEGFGLFSLNPKTKQQKSYSTNNSHMNRVIYGILQDNKGNLWLSTNNSLVRYSPDTNKFENYSVSDGLQGNEFNYGSYLKTKSGELVFGGFNGFTIFDPDKIKEDLYKAPLRIMSLNVRGLSNRVNPIQSEKINLEYNQNDLTINYGVLDFSRPNNSVYSYKLEGFNDDWVFAGGKRIASYTNLDPGNYTFKVKASNYAGLWMDNISSLSFTIQRPIWKTWWAYTTYMLVFLISIIVLRHYFVQRIRTKALLKQERLQHEISEETNRQKLQLFTNISHDFRTPLTLIISYVRSLMDNKDHGPIITKKLSIIYRNAGILLQLINQLLDLRSIEFGKMKMRLEKVDMIKFVKDLKELFDEFAESNNISYDFNTNYQHLSVEFDQVEMKKVILNILSNAFKFTPVGGNISINISTDNDNLNDAKRVILEIRNSNEGIAQTDLNLIFDRYFQLGQKNKKQTGSGVGLALAKEIVELHNGTITATSREGLDVTLQVVLPLESTDKSQVIHIHPQPINPNNELISTPDDLFILSTLEKDDLNFSNAQWGENNEEWETILIVEDNPEVRQIVIDELHSNYNILLANNGISGLDLAQNNDVQLIISDVMMPEMDGMEMCKRIKENNLTSHIPVILLTAKASDKAKYAGFDTGADIYLTKPFDSKILRVQIVNLLKSRRQFYHKIKQEFILSPSKNIAESGDEKMLLKVVQIIEDNISEPNFSAPDLASKLFMSQSVVYRKIKALTGNSISGLIREIRLKRAAYLLGNSSDSISEIAFGVGFGDLKYFRDCFRKVYGDTPSSYRQKNMVK